MFVKYKKIRTLGNPENEGILNWEVIIQEKIDWANLSIWREEDWLYIWSRNNEVWSPSQRTWFRGAVDYIYEREDIFNKIFNSLEEVEWTKDIRLYWEWLVKHTIWNYNPEAYNHFYLFDISVDWIFISQEKVSYVADLSWIKTPCIWATITNPTKEEVLEYVNKSSLWPDSEGVVIKNKYFINKFWDQAYAKIVWERFKEVQILEGNIQGGDNEAKIVLKYCTEGRVRKIIHKIEQSEWRDITIEDTWRIVGMVQYDIIIEEAWNISKIWLIDFKRLKWLIWKTSAQIALNIINNA